MSSLYRLFRQSSSRPTSAITATSSRTTKSFLRDIKKKSNLDNLVQKFKKSCEDDRFRAKRGIYEFTIRRLAAAKCFDWIEEILEDQKKYKEISKEGFNVRLISLYGQSGMLDNAHKVFDEMPLRNCKRTVMSFNALLAACVNSKKFDKVDGLFRELPKKLDIEPDLVSFNTVIKALCEMGSVDTGISLLDEMEKAGMEPNLVTFNTLINALCANGQFSDAERIWDRMVEKNISPDTRSYNSKLRGLVLEKKTESAVELFEEMKNKGIKPDVFTFKALINGFIDVGNLQQAERWYGEMESSGCKPDRSTYSMLIPFACEKGDLGFALKLSKDAFKMKCVVDGAMLQRVVDELVKESKIQEAEELVKLVMKNGSHRHNCKLKLPSDE